MRIAFFTSNKLRHLACSAIIRRHFEPNLHIFCEDSKKIDALSQHTNAPPIILKHLQMRNDAERRLLNMYRDEIATFPHLTYVPRGWFSTNECLHELESRKIDVVAVYGTSIIRGEIIRIFNGRIINMHLGISPFYRGSGTNFFAIVYGEPEFYGATFMHLDHGIDTGKIIHQIRPHMASSDSFYDMSAKFLVDSFESYNLILKRINRIYDPPVLSSMTENKTRRVFKRSDFTEQSVCRMWDVMERGLIKKYLATKPMRDSLVPILQNPELL